MHVAGAKCAAFQVAVLIEDEERMVACAAEVPIPNAALLIAMRRAYARVQIEHHAAALAVFGNLVDPMAREIGERGEIFRSCQPVGLKSPHLTRQRAQAFRGFAADDPAHGWVVS